MANTLILKKSSTPAAVPLAGDLEYGELAVNYADGKLYMKKSDNSIISLGAAGSGGLDGAIDETISGDWTFTGDQQFTGELDIYRSSDGLIARFGSSDAARQATWTTFDPAGGAPGAGHRLNAQSSAGEWEFEIAGQDRLRVDDVGVWVEPRNSDGTAALLLRSDVGDIAGITFGNASDLSRGDIRYDNALDRMEFRVDNLTMSMILKDDVLLYDGGSLRMRTTNRGTCSGDDDTTPNTSTSGHLACIASNSLPFVSFHDASGDRGAYIQHVNNSQMTVAAEEGYLRFVTGGSEDMRLLANGVLHVDATVVENSTLISDRRHKEDLRQVDSALEKIGRLNGYHYRWIDSGRWDVGLVAQEVQEVLPHLVQEVRGTNKGDSLVLSYNGIHALTVEAIKELTARVAALEELHGSP